MNRDEIPLAHVAVEHQGLPQLDAGGSHVAAGTEASAVPLPLSHCLSEAVLPEILFENSLTARPVCWGDLASCNKSQGLHATTGATPVAELWKYLTLQTSPYEVPRSCPLQEVFTPLMEDKVLVLLPEEQTLAADTNSGCSGFSTDVQLPLLTASRRGAESPRVTLLTERRHFHLDCLKHLFTLV